MSHSNGSSLQFVNETDNIIAESNGGGLYSTGMKRSLDDSDSDSGTPHLMQNAAPVDGPKPGKKTKGRVKIKMEFIENKLRRYTTFSKRKTGIMKKAYELSTLTGTQVMLLVASETGHVYTFATRKLQPMITSDSGKALIQTCLNSPDNPPMGTGQSNDDQRMNPTGFEEPELTYGPVSEEDVPSPIKNDLTRGAGLQFVAGTAPATPEPSPTPALQSIHPQIAPQPSPLQSTTTSMAASPRPQPPSFQTTTSTAPSSASKTQTVTVPTGGIIFPQATALPPGTPIAFASAPFTQATQQPGSNQPSMNSSAPTQQAIYRIPAPGQVLSLPGFTTSSANTTQSAQSVSNASVVMPQPIAVLSGTPTSAGGTQTPGAFMYQTPQGVVYATSGCTMPEGFNFIVPQTPTLNVSRDQQSGGMTQQYITIPVPVSSLATTNQPVIQTSDITNSTATDLSKGRK